MVPRIPLLPAVMTAALRAAKVPVRDRKDPVAVEEEVVVAAAAVRVAVVAAWEEAAAVAAEPSIRKTKP